MQGGFNEGAGMTKPISCRQATVIPEIAENLSGGMAAGTQSASCQTVVFLPVGRAMASGYMW